MPMKIITHKNGVRKIIGTGTAEEKAEWTARFSGATSFPSARAHSAGAKEKPEGAESHDTDT